MTYELLNTTDDLADLRRLDRCQLESLANGLRAFVLDSVSQTGGHLSSNLGTVESTIALHYVFNTPEDRVAWDAGHQSYPHKVLADYRDQMDPLHQPSGISGFPRCSESPYDAFGTAHSSTSTSAAFDMALGAKTGDEDRVAIVVIDDGTMSIGVAFETMNNAGIYKDLSLVVVLNNNDMSISSSAGALNRYLVRLMSGQFYVATKKGVEKPLSMAPPVLEFTKRFERHTKGIFAPVMMFEELGFNYVDSIDRHDLESLVPMLQNICQRAREGGEPQLLYVVTKKGQSRKLAEADPTLYRGPGKSNSQEGIKSPGHPARVTYTQVFGQRLCGTAAADKCLVGITSVMREGSGMAELGQHFPDRYCDVGIAEQHVVTFAGGLVCEGLKPVVAIYPTFLRWGYDRLIRDVALQNLPVILTLDRAGLVGTDGATHADTCDIAYLCCIPSMMVMTLADEDECCQLLSTVFAQGCLTAVHYPRDAGTGVAVWPTLEPPPMGEAEVRHTSTTPADQHVAILVSGSMIVPTPAAVERSDATVVNVRFVKSLDVAFVLEMVHTYGFVVTAEEGCMMGGAGSARLETLAVTGVTTPVLQLGLLSRFVDHGDHAVPLT